MGNRFKFISSLEKVFFDFPENISAQKSGTFFKNEIYSFQLVCEVEDERHSFFTGRCNCRIELDSEIKDCITLYSVDYVPSKLTHYPGINDDDYITKTPGLFPDPMKKIRDNKVTLFYNRATALWIAVEPNGIVFGEYPINIKIYNEENELLADLTYTVKIINAMLPKLDIKTTGWFHGDSVASLHNVEIQSDEYFEIYEKFLDTYVKFGYNVILTPIFTPPLDTDEGAERMTNQLTGVTLTDGEYSFDFSLLGRFIDMCLKHGIEYFEMAHLFTQWGAYYTPKIMATADGEYKRIFGWDKEALSEEYRAFLSAFLPALVDFLKKKGVYERCLFHISDEPNEKHEKQYESVQKIVLKYIEKEKLMDAISDYVFFEKGLIYNPVVCNDHIMPFIDNKVKNLWTYYCCVQGERVSNRFMAMPAYRNRILGYQLYKYNVTGFLQWGFNFWLSERSRSVIDPYAVTDALTAFPSGDAFIVYPLDNEGEVVPSIRLFVFNEGLQDMRALRLLESLVGREEVLKMLDDIDGFDNYPRNSEYILNIRNEINKRISEAI